jgi:predicted nucleic acid-binding protein
MSSSTSSRAADPWPTPLRRSSTASRGGAATGVLASIALTEVLTRPAAAGDAELFERYAEELRSVPNLRIVALDAETAIDAAWGRSGGRDLGDAVHVATARRAGATCFVTNDLRVRGRAGVEIIRLAEITVGAGEAET